MEFKKSEFLKVLQALKPGLDEKSMINQMKNISFRGQDVVTYKDSVCVLYPFNTNFVASVNYKDLFRVIDKLPTEIFEMHNNDNEVIITAAGTRAGLVTTIDDEISTNIDSLIEQLPNDTNEFSWNALPQDFMTGAALCIPAASTDLSQGVLTCLYAKDTDLICSDNLRVSSFTLAHSLNSEFFIRASIVKELASFEFDQLCVAKSWVHFSAPSGAILSVRLIKGEGLTYFKQLFDGFVGEPIDLPEDMKELIESASVMASDEQTRDMTITFENGKVVCGTSGPRGWIEKEMPINYNKDQQLNFMISAAFLRQILHMPLKMTVGKDRSLFESGSFKHMLIHRIAKK